MILQKTENKTFPFDWVDLDYLPDSKGGKFEVYLKDNNDINLADNLISLFDYLFLDTKYDILIFSKNWGDFCIDLWDLNKDTYEYDNENLSVQTKKYLSVLHESKIEMNYTGNCLCLDWNFFLKVVLDCIINHIAPYSPIFFSEKYNFFFYFHYSGSIGLFFKEKNTEIKKIEEKARIHYGLVQ